MEDREVLTGILEDIGLDPQTVLNRPQTNFDLGGNLYSLDLSGNNLDVVPDLSNFQSLSVLEIGFNSISEVDEMIFKQNKRMMKINLSNNSLTEIPERLLEKQVGLQQFSLSRNQISSLPDNLFRRNVNLHTLLLGNNPLKSLPSSLHKLRNLRYLDLKSAGIYDVVLNSESMVSNFLTEIFKVL